MSPDQQARAAAVQEAPADAAKAAATSHFEALQSAQQAATNPAATTPGASPAQAAASASPSAPAPPPGADTASSWSSTSVTNGGVGDAELDAALKGAVMENLKKDPFSPEVVAAENARLKDEGAAGLAAQKDTLNADAIRRGIGSTGVAAQLGGEAESAARASVANQQRQTMTEFAKLSSEQKQQAIGAAQNLATDLANRGISMQQLALQRESMQPRGGGGGNDNMIEIDNGDGTTSQVDLRLVDLMLGMGEGGMW